MILYRHTHTHTTQAPETFIITCRCVWLSVLSAYSQERLNILQGSGHVSDHQERMVRSEMSAVEEFCASPVFLKLQCACESPGI